MSLSQRSLLSLASDVLRACRAAGLLALLVLVPGGILGAAVSSHLTQVFDRVTGIHAAAIPFAATSRVFGARTSL